MHEDEVKRERGSGRKIQLVNLVNTRFEYSESTFSTQFRRYARWYDQYRQISQGKFQPFKNNVTIPILFGAVQSSVAQKSSMILQSPYVTMLAGGPEDQAVARRQETLVNRQLDDSDTYAKGIKLLLHGDLYGTAIFRWFWRLEEGETTFRFDLGEGEKLETRPATKFNGPDWEPVDPVDVYIAPGHATIETMP